MFIFFIAFQSLLLIQTLLELELGWLAVLQLYFPDNSFVFEIEFWFYKCEA